MSTELAQHGGGYTAEQVDRHVLRRTEFDTVTGCLEFTGHLNANGYGVVKVGHKTLLAHRLVWMAANGEVPDGHEICHHCDNRKCVLLSHLFNGTRTDNMQDMLRKGRGVKARGENHGMSKLTEQDVRELRRLRSEGHSYGDLMARFGVNKTTVANIIKGKLWRAVS